MVTQVLPAHRVKLQLYEDMTQTRGTGKGVDTSKTKTIYQIRHNNEVLYHHKKCKQCWLWLDSNSCKTEDKNIKVFAKIGLNLVQLERYPTQEEGQKIQKELEVAYLREIRFRNLYKRYRKEPENNEATVAL